MFRVLSLALVACLLMAGSAFADMKIGVFNSQAVAMDSDAAKAAQQKLQSQFGAEKTQLEKQAKDLQSKGEALQAQVAKMSAKEREDKQMEFLRLRRAFEEKSRNFARKVENTENQPRPPSTSPSPSLLKSTVCGRPAAASSRNPIPVRSKWLPVNSPKSRPSLA